MIIWLGTVPRNAGRGAALRLSLHGKALLPKHGPLYTTAHMGTRIRHSFLHHARTHTEDETHLNQHTENTFLQETHLCADLENVSLSTHITPHLSTPESLELSLEQVRPPLCRADFIFLAALLSSCGKSHALPQGQLIHIHIIKCEIEHITFVQNLLLQMYGKCGAPKDAHAVFANMQHHDKYSWNFMASAYTYNAEWDLATELFNQLRIEGAAVDEYVLSRIISACAGKEDLLQGKHVHTCLVGSEYEPMEVVNNALMNLYGKLSCLPDASKLFSRMVERSVISWSSIITSYTQHNNGREAIWLWCCMQQEAVMPNRATLVGIIDACANQAALHRGKQVHCCLLGSLFENDVMVLTTLINMYGRCGDVGNALKVFEQLQEPNVVSWTAIMAGYAKHGHIKEAFEIFDKMQQNGIIPNKISYVCILDAYNSREFLEKAKQMHACIKHIGFDTDIVVGTALVNMYGKCGSPSDARVMFDEMPSRNLVSWNTMLSVYAQHGHRKEASELFSLMLWKGETLNSVTFTSMLLLCANEGALMEGKWMHDQVVRRGYFNNGVVGNALINMYVKCGYVNSARNVFERMPERTVVSWSSMIPAYAHHGQGKEILPMLQRMKREGVHPNRITFKVILSACSHVGLVEDAKVCLTAMTETFGLKADAEHYDCVIDLLGRAGRLDEAEKMIFQMPVQPSLLSWMMLLGACSNQADLQRGEWIAYQVFEMYPEYHGPYVILSNMYVVAGRDSDALRLLSRMKAKGLMQREECSYIEVDGIVKTFSCVKRSYSQAEEIYAELYRLKRLVANAGFQTILHEELLGPQSEGSGYASCFHTERLAIAFGFLSTNHKGSLFVAKSTQMCSDCHVFLKVVSKLCEREIIISDSFRLHRMQNGACSCAS